MEHILPIKNTALALLATVGSVLANLFGGWDVALQVLIGFMAADYVTGFLVAAVFKRSGKTENGALESGAGLRGILKKCGVLLLVYLSVLLDRTTGGAYVRTAVCLFFTANEGLSILENLGLMGVPYPAFLKNMLEAMNKSADEGGTGGAA